MKKSFCIILLLLTFYLLLGFNSYAQGSNQNPGLTRSKALTILKGCATRPVTLGCNEETAWYLIGLYNRGDRSLLKPLLDAGLTSDGALSEMLGDFYANVLWKHPHVFLEALRSRPRKEQKQLAWLAGAIDGSGMSANMLLDVRRTLGKLSSNRGTLSSARLT